MNLINELYEEPDYSEWADTLKYENVSVEHIENEINKSAQLIINFMQEGLEEIQAWEFISILSRQCKRYKEEHAEDIDLHIFHLMARISLSLYYMFELKLMSHADIIGKFLNDEYKYDFLKRMLIKQTNFRVFVNGKRLAARTISESIETGDKERK